MDGKRLVSIFLCLILLFGFSFTCPTPAYAEHTSKWRQQQVGTINYLFKSGLKTVKNESSKSIKAYGEIEAAPSVTWGSKQSSASRPHAKRHRKARKIPSRYVGIQARLFDEAGRLIKASLMQYNTRNTGKFRISTPAAIMPKRKARSSSVFLIFNGNFYEEFVYNSSRFWLQKEKAMSLSSVCESKIQAVGESGQLGWVHESNLTGTSVPTNDFRSFSIPLFNDAGAVIDRFWVG